MTSTPIRKRPILIASATFVMWTVSLPQYTHGQLPPEITEDEKIRVTEVTPETALAQLQSEYAELLRTKGASHPDSRGVAEQIAQIRSGLAALGRPVPTPPAAAEPTQQPSTPTNPPASGTSAAAEDDQLSLNANQIQVLRAQYEQRLRQFGADDPMVKRLETLLNRINVEASQAVVTPVMPATVNPVEAPETSDPYVLLIELAKRVVLLEQEVLKLRGEVAALRKDRTDPLVVPSAGAAKATP